MKPSLLHCSWTSSDPDSPTPQNSSASNIPISPPTPGLVSPPTPTEDTHRFDQPFANTPVSRPTGIVNPLVSVGLIRPDLVYILVTPAEDDAVFKNS